jgi:hypothetical protein
MSNSITHTYLCLATKTAQKLGRNGGSITFKILADTARQQLFLRLVANEGGGFFSPDIVLFESVEACLPDDRTQPLPAKIFAAAFTGKSANNPGFMAAILRTEGLLGPVEGKPNLHLLTGDWSDWKAGMLALNGEPYVPETKMAITPEMTRQEHPELPDGNEETSRRKGNKRRIAKGADEADHAHPA